MRRPFPCRPIRLAFPCSDLKPSAPLRNPELWQRLETTPITLSDGSDLGVALTDRFDIRPRDVAASLTEYRRFLYLVAISDQVLAPSPMVDQIWHLHLRDGAGWSDYANRMFGRELRHIPGRPRPEIDPAYEQTLALLSREFGVRPAAPFWPKPDDFHRATARVSLTGILGVIASLPIGWAFGTGWGIVVFLIGGAAALTGNHWGSRFRLAHRGDGGSDSSGGDYDGGDGGGCGGD